MILHDNISQSVAACHSLTPVLPAVPDRGQAVEQINPPCSNGDLNGRVAGV